MLAGAVALAGCGSDDDDEKRLVVSAATSLKTSFDQYAGGFEPADVRLAFGGSDELAAQIRQGVRPGLYAAASETLPAELHAEGLVERPVPFASNRLVVATRTEAGGIDDLGDLAQPGLDLVIGAEEVPVGSYTREVLGRLPVQQRRAILANVRSNEPDVGGVIAKVAGGAADAGFVYATDVAAADGELALVEIPPRLRPDVTYAAAVVRDADNADAARQFLDGLLSGEGRSALRRAGFGPPP